MLSPSRFRVILLLSLSIICVFTTACGNNISSSDSTVSPTITQNPSSQQASTEVQMDNTANASTENQADNTASAETIYATDPFGNTNNPSYPNIDWESLNENLAMADDKNDWIESTIPKDQTRGVPQDIVITIVFKQSMYARTLNKDIILILDGKHGDSVMSSMFDFNYIEKSKTLKISFTDPRSGYGTGNGIGIIITNKIKNTSNKSPDKNYQFGFAPTP